VLDVSTWATVVVFVLALAAGVSFRFEPETMWRDRQAGGLGGLSPLEC
jgi:hypothetical protein